MAFYLFPVILFLFFEYIVRMTDPIVAPHLPPTLSPSLLRTLFVSPSPHVSIRWDTSPLASSLRLLCDDCHLPLALNSHVQRADFDPDFVASLISRNSGDDIVDIVLDTGCTFAITQDRRDFIKYTEGSMGNIHTVNRPTSVSGYGKVRWTVISEDGRPVQLIVPRHHVPASKVQLLSPQDFCQYAGFDCSKDQCGGNLSYFWMNSDHDGTCSQCPIDPQSNLAVVLAKTLCHDGGCSFGEPSEEEQ
jgi:hypothetical protein